MAAASQETHLSKEELLEALGEWFFQSLVQPEGQTHTDSPQSVLQSTMGSETLKDWLASYQSVCESVFGREVSLQMPHFYCQEPTDSQPGLLLHCWLPQGPFLVPFAKGLVCEAAAAHFQLQVQLEPLSLAVQEEHGKHYTR